LARPQAFDTDEALHKALKVFWKQGFEAASLPDLMAATGLSKSSLYATFGNKRELFIRAFDRYRADRVREMRFILSRDTGRQAVHNFFCKIIDDASSGEFRNGCMSTNQAIELAPADPEIRDRVCSDFSSIEEALWETIVRGQTDSSVRSTRDAHLLARQLTAAFPGIQVMVRSGMNKANLSALLDAVLASLDETSN
jgi:TetR/AcrR family transcriptional repressor of nem operon